jgi:hypothetical protein
MGDIAVGEITMGEIDQRRFLLAAARNFAQRPC